MQVDTDTPKSLGVPSRSESVDSFSQFFDASTDLDAGIFDDKTQVPPLTLDLLERMKNTYRLLDLIYEQGSGGAVEKVIIAQESIGRFANSLEPRSYASLTKVNFRALDKHRIRPQGVYGSITAVADFLQEIGCINQDTHGLLVAKRDESSGITRPTLRPGLYIVDARETEPDLFYVIFWPEDATWDDTVTSSASRNRVTFMRYLTKLCDQLICFISDEHSEKLAWQEDDMPADEDNILDSEDKDLYNRLFSFQVKQTDEEEESAIAKDGFMIQHSALGGINEPPKGYPLAFPLEALQPQLIVGEVNQAIIHIEYIPESTKTEPVNWTLSRELLEGRLSESYSQIIVLHDKLDKQSLQTLLDLKLGARCGRTHAEWKQQTELEKTKREAERKNVLYTEKEEMATRIARLREAMPFWLVKEVCGHYSTISQDSLIATLLENQNKTIDGNDVSGAIETVDDFFAHYQTLRTRILTQLRPDLTKLETNHYDRYNILKRHFRTVNEMINQSTTLTDEQIQGLVDLIQAPSYDFDAGFFKIIGTQRQSWAGMLKRITGLDSSTSRVSNSLPTMDDIAFANYMDNAVALRPVYGDAAAEIKGALMQALKRKVNKIYGLVMSFLENSVRQAVETGVNSHFDKRRIREEEGSWKTLLTSMQEALFSAESNGKRRLLIRSVKRESKSSWNPRSSDKFCLQGIWQEPNLSGFQYTLYQMEITSDDYQKVSTDSAHVCQPVIRGEMASRFILPSAGSLRFLRLVGKDSVLAVIEDEVSLKIFFDSLSGLAAAIESGRPKKRFFYEKIGRRHMFAVDETRRLFTLLATHPDAINIHVYIFEHEGRTLNARGGAINATKWFPKGIPELSAMTFVTGSEELLLVDNTGFSRVFYLTTETFMPSTLQLGTAPKMISSSADGSCLFVLDLFHEHPRLRCFHWASFGTTHGIVIPLPPTISPRTPVYISSVGQRNSTHILYLDYPNRACGSLSMHITRKSTEFEFSVSDNQHVRERSGNTLNNSLIDCHSGVWTRFPLQSPIRRETTENARPTRQSIVFVSSSPSYLFPAYFAEMRREFAQKTHKPTGKLNQVKVTAIQWDQPYRTEEISSLEAGDWFVGLFCLIPIHIAVTGSNRFIPLKDGVISSTFEQSLLGASVAEISEAISFGWYESIFNSYLAAKPVKVVTSMGEQSVGKSYALNHFVDTSFAGSAMRCTEGAWMSVTPTRDMLYVAIDFEGVHSIERSAQEDTLLVLLNTAISNFVLFRNNFAMSRDIAELFTSFQSCTTILDPASNPKLFQSNLVIIVKDVILSDAREIKNEFTQKFARIVQQERGQNFITKLHKGHLDIIPWPVIESPQFYKLFELLKDRFNKRPTTHHHAIQFLDVLKTLMAKLKANDWGALDQNLATQRAEFLNGILVTALAFGSADPVLEEPLKNCDTDEVLDENPTPHVFYVSTASNPGTGRALSPEGCLQELRVGWNERLSRFEMDEAVFIEQYNAYLQTIADTRIAYVRRWLRDNTIRFGEKVEILALIRRFEGLAKELKAAVVLCGLSCSSCSLLCLDQKHHGGKHDCKTSHRCPRLCTFESQHTEDTVPSCDMPAGHADRHVCKTLPHLCGAPCDLSGRNGCMLSCTKPPDHIEDEHLCPARVHACGEPCGVIRADGVPLCTRNFDLIIKSTVASVPWSAPKSVRCVVVDALQEITSTLWRMALYIFAAKNTSAPVDVRVWVYAKSPPSPRR
ncbi:hypothetical protein M408DRAFT_26650 [Serendipita vermifera MAFF 305830]|uniref:VWFA domain-containing protein n=1 Tax=Serendipita vermifera MAFF 305830 TaxID=933852 RepID=A0A0C3AXZ6_SERVB|nr:hypothetical protein M408DRAFT_26650 [Serendipita vermifera MAFF 305830]